MTTAPDANGPIPVVIPREFKEQFGGYGPWAGANAPEMHGIKDARATLARSGFAVARGRDITTMAATLAALANGLGRPVPARKDGELIQTLNVIDRHEARPRSLSQLSGRGAQPWHVDGAHLPEPPRYLVLGCLDALGTGAPTTGLLHFGKVGALAGPAARCQPFAVRNGRSSFYATVVNPDCSWVRYDPGCMTPLTPEGEELAEELSLKNVEPSAAIAWHSGDILVIDNWAVFHRRFAPAGNGQRTLMRISVMES